MPRDWKFYERALFEKGIEKVAGIDEAGRGPLAGPVVAAACILKKRTVISGIDDSKKLSIKERERLFLEITNKHALAWSFYFVSSQLIDKINILEATRHAMLQCLHSLPIKPEYALIDAVSLKTAPCPILPIIKGDTLSQSIAAASVIAKVLRDKIMVEVIHKKWPEYGFDRHKGYGTAYHLEQLDKFGPCHEHRRSFAPVREKALFI